MKRRTATVVGAWLAAAALAVAVPDTAYAAHGVLIIDGAAFPEPSGCLALGDFAPPVVANLTDSGVQVRTGSGCTGGIEHVIAPGEVYAPTAGRSVYVP
ncbi:hypothetical protein ACFVVL_33500 [Kitasatospora sp. NPDC058115]|uniref:hypothetical protein n=1 Tax=Kitasatospora sp. NPDC058115 TaxID=3346347 RepID=UPI0036D8AE2E